MDKDDDMSLYIFDKDKTLLRPKKNFLHLKQSPKKPEQQEVRAGVCEKLDELRAQGHLIAMASNQNMVARGNIGYDDAVALMEDCAEKCGGVEAWRFSPYLPQAKLLFWNRHNPFARDDPSRKPNPGMILDLMNCLNAGPEDTIVVGDARVDKKAAEAAGAAFIDAEDFFGTDAKQS